MQLAKQRAGRLGAFRRNELYGNPGTLAGRRKGGLSSFKRAKKISVPPKGSELAEFIGVVLGDGSLNEYQVRVYFNAKTDRDYAGFVKRLVSTLFDLDGTIAPRPKNSLELVISSKSLVRLLEELGLQKGNKIANQVSVPAWVLGSRDYIQGCLRGLIDTDGGVYFHTHTTKGITYKNIALCFTSRSRPLLNAVEQMFSAMGIKAKNDLRERILVYNRSDIDKYMIDVSSHNVSLLKRFASYKGSKILA